MIRSRRRRGPATAQPRATIDPIAAAQAQPGRRATDTEGDTGAENAPLGLALRALTGSLFGLGVWFYLQLCVLLVSWIGLLVVAAGWSPVVVTGQSMSPSLNVGDVMLVSPTAGDVTDGSVIVFEDPATGDTITHRVVGRTTDGLRTKGDANVDVDPRPLPVADVDGVARIVVPLIGLPVVWLANADWTFLGAWLLVTLIALVAVGFEIASRSRRLHAETLGVDVTAQPLRRARSIVALVLIGQMIIDPTSLSVIDDPSQVRLLVGGIIIVIGGLNALSWRVERADEAPDTQRRVALVELAIDSVVVLMLTVPGAGGPTWVLLAFPVVEAATRFRIRGALTHWAGLLVARVFITGVLSSSEPNEVIPRLDAVVQQSGVLLLVAVPGAYLAEQLLADIGTQRAAAGEASRRSDLLGVVATAARDLTSIGADIPKTIVDATVTLGFDAVDVCYRESDRSWDVLAAAGSLPTPTKASGLLARRDFGDEILIDGLQPGSVLGQYGLIAMSVHVLVRGDQGDVILRAAGTSWPTDVEQEAVRLLGAQARVALRNEGFVTSLRQTNEELVDRSVTDQLTGLNNRAGIQRALDEAMATVQRHEQVALMFLDLDGFKAINDALGHDAGDRLLIDVGRRLIDLVGDQGTVGRLGGDEFVVVLPGRRDKLPVEILATEVCARVGAPYPDISDWARVTASVGLAHGGQSSDSTTLTQQADAAMFAAKRAGKGRWVWYDPTEEATTVDPRRIALETALARQQIELAVRPACEGDAIMAFAPRPSWTTPTLGALDTADLFGLAQELGLSAQTAEHVLSSVVNAISEEQRATSIVLDRWWLDMIGDSAEQVLRRLERNSDGQRVTMLVQIAEREGRASAYQGLGTGRALVTIGEDGSGADWVWMPETVPLPGASHREAVT